MASEIIEIASGDIPPHQDLTADIDGVQDMADPGWECWSQVLRTQGKAKVFQDRRQVTELVTANGRSQFRCRLSQAEADLLLAGPNSAFYTWVVEVSNPSIPYRKEHDFQLLVRPNGVG